MPETKPREFGGNRFHRQRGTDTPFAAHRDAEEAAQNQEHGQARREGRDESEARIAHHVDHHDRTAAIAVGEPAEHKGADGTRGERERRCDGHRRHTRAELPGDVRLHQQNEKEIEGVERPAEIARQDDVFLLRGPAFEGGEGHLRNLVDGSQRANQEWRIKK